MKSKVANFSPEPNASIAWLTIEQVAEITGYKYYTIRDAIVSGELRASKLRSQWRVKPGDLEVWYESGLNEVKPMPDPHGSRIRRRNGYERHGSFRSLNQNGSAG